MNGKKSMKRYMFSYCTLCQVTLVNVPQGDIKGLISYATILPGKHLTFFSATTDLLRHLVPMAVLTSRWLSCKAPSGESWRAAGTGAASFPSGQGQGNSEVGAAIIGMGRGLAWGCGAECLGIGTT